MKLYKRILIIIVVCFVIFAQIKVPVYAVVGDTILDNSYNRYLIGSMLVASGLVFKAVEPLNKTIDKVISDYNSGAKIIQFPGGPNDPKNWGELIFYLTAIGVTVYDLGLDVTKQIINLPIYVVEYFQNWVNDLFDEGDNISYDSSFYIQDYSSSFGVSGISKDKKIFINGNQVLKINFTGHGVNNTEKGNLIVQLPNGDILTSSHESIPYGGRAILNYWIAWNTIGYRGEIVVSDGWGLSIRWRIPSNYVPITYDYGHNIYGTPNIVDNQNYQYTHNLTDAATLPIPIQSPVPLPDGYYVPDATIDDLVDVTASDIANSDISGVEMPLSPPEVTPEPVPYPDIPGDDVATEEDYDNPNKRALYQKKFPFSLPWDIKAIFNLLNAESKAPRFEIDILTQSLKSKIGITKDTKFIFDMAAFPLVGQMSRFFTFIGFCLTLIFVTRLIIKS